MEGTLRDGGHQLELAEKCGSSCASQCRAHRAGSPASKAGPAGVPRVSRTSPSHCAAVFLCSLQRFIGCLVFLWRYAWKNSQTCMDLQRNENLGNCLYVSVLGVLSLIV